MANFTQTAGLNKIDSLFQGTYATGTGSFNGGDECILENGVYTFDHTAFQFAAGAWGGRNFSGISNAQRTRFVARNHGLAILDFSGCANSAIDWRGIDLCDFEGFKIISAAGDYVNANDASLSSDGRRFIDCILAGYNGPRNRTFFRCDSNQNPGLSTEFIRLVLDSTYRGQNVIRIQGPASDIDVTIVDLDASLHAPHHAQGVGPDAIPGELEGCCLTAISLEDCRDVRVIGTGPNSLRMDDFQVYGGEIVSVSEAKGCRDVRFSRAVFRRSGSVSIHAGHTQDKSGYPWPVAEAYNIIYDRCDSYDTVDGYSFEFENGVHKSKMLGCRAFNPTRYAFPLAEDTYENLIQGCFAIAGAGTSAVDGTGVVFSNGRKHVVIGNTFIGFRQALIIQRGAGTYDGTGSGGYFVATERNVFQNNVIANCGSVYSTGSNAATGMPNEPLANELGLNAVHVTSSYALVNAVAKTQPEFEALFPGCFRDGSDDVVATLADMRFVEISAGDYRTYDDSPAEALEAGFYRSSRAIPSLPEPASADPSSYDIVLVLPNTRGGEKFFNEFSPFEGETPLATRVEVRDNAGALDTSLAGMTLTGRLSIDEAPEVDIPIFNNDDGSFTVQWPTDASVFVLPTGKRSAKARFDTAVDDSSHAYYLKRFCFMIKKRV